MLLKNATGVTVGTKPASRVRLGNTVVWKPKVVGDWEKVGGPYGFSSIDLKSWSIWFSSTDSKQELSRIFSAYNISEIYMQAEGATTYVPVSKFEDQSWAVVVSTDKSVSLSDNGFQYGKGVTFFRKATP